MVKLYYSKNEDPVGDVPCFEFKDVEELYLFFEDMTDKQTLGNGNFKEPDRVFTFSYTDPEDSGKEEVIITSKIYFITDIMSKWEFFGFDAIKEFFLFEHRSFEDAYKSALEQKEEDPLCYKPDLDPTHN